jgi:hypothetical protein
MYEVIVRAGLAKRLKDIHVIVVKVRNFHNLFALEYLVE